MSRPEFRILFYVQHLLGIGHLMRANRIALALRETGFKVALVTGGVPVAGIDTPGIAHVKLPPIAVSDGDFSSLVDANGNPVDEAYKNERCRQLLAAYDSLRPDIVILEAFPFGRRQVRFELLPLLDVIESSMPKPLLVSSVRDIVQRRSKAGRDEETVQMINQHFDKLLVHGDPQFVQLGDSFPLAALIEHKIEYTGWVSGVRAKASAERFDVVVSAGGGAVGMQLIHSAIAAAKHLPSDLSWCVVTGPNLSDADFRKLSEISSDNVLLERFRPDFAALLTATRLSVSQAGYNTVSDVLQAGCRALLIPYSASGETEQTDRANRLKELGLATTLLAEDLTSEVLASMIEYSLSQPLPLDKVAIELDGAARTASSLLDMVESRNCASEEPCG